MENNDIWNKFEQTGAILDYLNYTACTKECFDETIDEIICTDSKEGEEIGSSQCDGDGLVNHANR